MRVRMLFAFLLAATFPAHADTSVQPGLWEKTEKVTLDGRELASRPRSVCLKPGEASLERLLLINDEEAAARGCKSEVQPAAGVVRMPMSCPARDDEPAVVAKLEVRYTPTSFEGSGSVEITPKARSQAQKGMSVLSGKRLGDC
jgi:hypothetical protein